MTGRFFCAPSQFQNSDLQKNGGERKFPTKHQWAQFFKILTRTDKWLLGLFSAALALSLIAPLRTFYLNNTEVAPAHGGTYAEAVIGFPRYLNAVLAPANDVDRDISAIIYSSLMKRNSKGQIILDLAEDYSISEDRKNYEIRLKKDIKWHDGKPLNADDIIFTVQIIQNPDYKSPLRSSLQGVEVEKIDEFSVRFILKNPYGPFLDNLAFGVLPKHIWENVSPSNFPLAELNLRPIGSGPYKFQKIQKDSSGRIKNIELSSFEKYYLGKPFIENIIFRFYKDEDAAIAAYNKEDVSSMSFISAGKIAELGAQYNLNEFILPHHFAVFFNQAENKALAEKPVREALLLATNKKEIIEKTIAGQAVETNSPLPQFFFGEQPDESADRNNSAFDQEKATEILETNGWIFPTIETGEGTTTSATRQKKIKDEGILLEISLTTVNWPELMDVADRLKSEWESIGAKINLNIKTTTEIQETIRNRAYQGILFGQILSPDPDPFAFWHSSQKKDPGLNLALYENKDVDKLLEAIRQETEPNKKLEQLKQFQKLVSQDIPAIFLYSPVYLFPTNPEIKGIEIKNGNLPSARFSEINKWYIKTKRAWK